MNWASEVQIPVYLQLDLNIVEEKIEQRLLKDTLKNAKQSFSG